MTIELFNNLIAGKIGTVVVSKNIDSEDWESEFWDEEKCQVNYNNIKYKINDEVNDIDTFFKSREINSTNLVLFRENGYRGIGCYNGLFFEKNQVYWLDIINDYCVYRVQQVR